MNIILAGSFRSGTTWLAEVMAEAFRAQLNYEPLEPTYTRIVRERRLRNRYLRPDATHPAEAAFVARMARGGVVRLPIKALGSRNPLQIRRWRFWRHNQLIKMIQGHLLLPYLAEHTPAKLVFCVRHPCAVIESLARQGWRHSDLHEFLDGRNDPLWQDHPRLHDRVDRGLGLLHEDLARDDRLVAPLERARRTALRWALENHFAGRLCRELHTASLTFEEFHAAPEATLLRVAAELGVERPRIPTDLRAASRTTSRTSPLHQAGANVTAHWRQELDRETMDAIAEMVACFDVELTDDENGRPDYRL